VFISILVNRKKVEKKTSVVDPFKGKFTRISAIPDTTVVPTKKGTDLYTKDDSYDSHIRLEDIGNGYLEICIDVFNSKLRNSSKAPLNARASLMMKLVRLKQ
jgi:hypothetical protein